LDVVNPQIILGDNNALSNFGNIRQRETRYASEQHRYHRNIDPAWLSIFASTPDEVGNFQFSLIQTTVLLFLMTSVPNTIMKNDLIAII